MATPLLDGLYTYPPPPDPRRDGTQNVFYTTYYDSLGQQQVSPTNLWINKYPNNNRAVNPRIPLGLGIEADVAMQAYNTWQTNAYNAYNNQNTGGSYYGSAPQPQVSNPEPPPLTWSEKYQLEGAPIWWKGMVASQHTPETEFATIMNTLIPYLSTEDQRQFASSLSRLFPDAFGHYSPEKSDLGTPKGMITPEQEQYFLSQKRAQDILGAMDKMKEATGKSDKDFGPGYEYVRQLAATMKDFGAREGYARPTRSQVVKLYSAFDPMLAEGKGEKLGAYGEMARSLAQPFFGAGSLIPVQKDQAGNWIFGESNKKWY